MKINQRLTDYLIQAFFIFSSVFLAFWLNRYQELYKEAYKTTEAKIAILREMKENLHMLEILHQERVPLIMGKKEGLSKLDTYKYFNQFNLPGGDKGITRAVFSKSAINLINGSNVNINIDLRQKLNQVYDHQRLFTEAESKLLDDFLNSFEVKKEENVIASYIIFYDLLGDVWGREATLINSMKEAIAELEG